MSLAKRISTVGGFTLLSRVFGFVRDMLIARYLGAGMAADAFFIAFKLPNFFRRLFGEGAFTVGFVPLYARFLGKDITPQSKAAADAFAGQVLSWLMPIRIVFLVIMEVAMVPVMFGLSGGFDGDTEKFDFAVELGRYTFPYLALISLMTFFTGMLNAWERFSAAAFAPVILNIFMISALLFMGETEMEKARWLAIAVSASGAGQLLWVFVAARRAGLSVGLPLPKISPEIRELFRVMGPAALGAGILQVNLLIDTLLAARLRRNLTIAWNFELRAYSWPQIPASRQTAPEFIEFHATFREARYRFRAVAGRGHLSSARGLPRWLIRNVPPERLACWMRGAATSHPPSPP